MAVVELIADGVHLDPHTVSMVFALVGAANIALVTDSMAATGLPDGDYQLGASEVTVANGEARLRSNGAIAGATSTPLDQVRNAVSWGLPLHDVLRCVTDVPAEILNDQRIGRITPGAFADAVVLTDELELSAVMRRGDWL